LRAGARGGAVWGGRAPAAAPVAIGNHLIAAARAGAHLFL
jgi:hypothetical protein